MLPSKQLSIFGSGLGIGTLGGLIGLGGAEFRLPLLISVFGFEALHAIILNKAISLVVVSASLPLRAGTVPWSHILAHSDVILTLLSGSIFGAWLGAGWATQMKSKNLSRILAILLTLIAILLLFEQPSQTCSAPWLNGTALLLAGITAGFGIGVVAALMGVAGGELLIPTIVLLFGQDAKLAGSLSLAVSLPTMLIGFARYSRDQSFKIIRTERNLLLVMATGSLLGVFIGGQLLGLISQSILLPLLSCLLIISAFKVWNHS